jgi:DnaJ like chaperone protein
MNGVSIKGFGKAIGGIVGFVTGGPVGSLLGLALGAYYDQNVRNRARRSSSPHEISQLFFEVAFEVMGRVAKVDGRISEDEVRVARRIMHGMQLSPEQVLEAIEHFTRGKAADYPIEARLVALAQQIDGRAELARAFVQLQLQAAIGAWPIDAEKRRVLWQIASALAVGRAEFAQIEALVRAYEHRRAHAPDHTVRIEESYRVLGVAEDASDEEVKTAYRRLMNQHHPDKLVARGLPQSMIGVAEQRTHEIRAAYERVRARRGFK